MRNREEREERLRDRGERVSREERILNKKKVISFRIRDSTLLSESNFLVFYASDLEPFFMFGVLRAITRLL